MWRQSMGRTFKVLSLSLPPEMVDIVEALAKEEKRTRSELFREAIRFYLQEKEWRKLQSYGRKKAAELGITEDDVERLVHESRAEQE